MDVIEANAIECFTQCNNNDTEIDLSEAKKLFYLERRASSREPSRAELN